MCRALDLAQGALYLIERSAYWIYQALPHIAKNMLYVHKLSFLTRISPSIDNYINGSADVSIFQARAQFEFEINLANIAKSAADLALRALRYFIGLFTERLSESSYDNPSYKSDFQMSGNHNRHYNQCSSPMPRVFLQVIRFSLSSKISM